MKLPEFLFVIINPMMRLLLCSPLHGILSGSLMLITFRGRNSGREFTTPVRYIENDGIVRCFTSSENQWWRNLRGGSDVVLRVRGKDGKYHASTLENDAEQTRQWLGYYLEKYPEDAVYHDIRLNKDKSMVEEDFEKALTKAIVVEANPI